MAGVFNLPGFTEFSPISDTNRTKAIASWQMVLYLLGNCFETTDETEEALLSGEVVVVDTRNSLHAHDERAAAVSPARRRLRR